MAKYETLIFILEGSLLNEKVAELNALSQTLKLAGREFGPAQRIKYNSLQEKTKLLGFDERIKLTLQEFFKNDWISARQAFDNQLQKQDKLNKDVLPFLDEVQNKVNLILLTKEKKDVASSRMQSTELLNYFSAVYFKDDLTSKLPDKKVLTTILQQQNLSPATCLVIGTNLVDEIQGAENANLDSLWLAPKKVKMPISPHPTLHLNKLSDLLFYLELS
ncbi:HAD family hydrolase [uncultured Lactobacillus sp.]|uniref:HAD family hydrolase n=1 Tax=uncultured Lactobacillus sp. TaxID=153152 RepID=UPI0025D78E34|nr:HAD family hydrolase [uncultured Lactobacillus sp.]